MNTSTLLYRPLTEDDLESVAALEAEAFSTPWTADQYRAIMRHGGCALFGALLGPVLAGYIAVSLQRETAEMEVYNIAVTAAFRRRGIASKLLSLALRAAAGNGATRAILEVRESNTAAIALYRSLDFIQVGIRRGYYHDTGENALVFARSEPLPEKPKLCRHSAP